MVDISEGQFLADSLRTKVGAMKLHLISSDEARASCVIPRYYSPKMKELLERSGYNFVLRSSEIRDSWSTMKVRGQDALQI